MKKMRIMCVTVMCMTALEGSSSVVTSLDIYLGKSAQDTERLQEELKDPVKLRTCLDEILNSHTSLEGVMEFKRKFGVDDEPMQRVLMDIIRESIAKTGGRIPERYVEREKIMGALWYLRGALRCMGACADADGKKLLMGIATDNGKDNHFRVEAIHAYINRADAQETRDAIIRFLADDMRSAIQPLYTVYYAAILTYDRAEGNPQKREAIIATVSAMLVKEEDKSTFAFLDGELTKRSKEYAESPQRKAALERMSKPPEKPQ